MSSGLHRQMSTDVFMNEIADSMVCYSVTRTNPPFSWKHRYAIDYKNIWKLKDSIIDKLYILNDYKDNKILFFQGVMFI